MPAPTALTAAALLAAKLVAVGLLLASNASPFTVALAFVGSFLGDVVLVAIVAALARGGERARAFKAAATLAALAVCAYAGIESGVRAATGAPLSLALLAYAQDMTPSLLPSRALVAGFGCTAIAFPLAYVLARVARRVSIELAMRPLAMALGVSLLCALGVNLASPAARSFGLAPVTSFVFDALAPREDGGPRRAWDAPSTRALPGADDTKEIVRDARPKHVVVWLAESTGARHVSLYGETDANRGNTPNLDALRAHSLRFTEYYAPTPISAKAIFSVLCGLYPLPEPAFEAREFPRIACDSLPETLAKSGYRSGLFHGGYFAFTDKLALLEERGFDTLIDGENVPARDTWWTNGWGVDDAAIVENSLAWLDRTRMEAPDAPTFAFVIPLLPHYEYFLPPTAPRPFGDASLNARHRNGVHYDDMLFGRLVDGYRARGMFADTLFVYVGDHGEAFGEHPNNQLHGSFVFDENVRAPLVLINERLFPRELVSARPGAHPDVLATITELLGIAPPQRTQSRSLVAEAFTPRPIPLGAFHPDPRLGIVDGAFKFVRDANTGAEALYDRAQDPGELRDVSALYPAVREELRARVRDFTARQPALLRAIPTRGAGYLDRFLATATVSPPEARAEMKVERSFNMERRCLLVHGPAVLEGDARPPPRSVGVGLTDTARRKRGAPVTARFTVGDAAPLELTVNDTFETTSKMALVPPVATESARVRVDIASERDVCVTLAP